MGVQLAHLPKDYNNDDSIALLVFTPRMLDREIHLKFITLQFMNNEVDLARSKLK